MARKSTGNYPSNWPEIAREIKEQAGWRCVRCGQPHNPADGYCLTVHHLDMNPANCAWWNLAALCQRCHLTIQAKVNMARPWMFQHSAWFIPYVAGYYAHRLGEPEQRDYVISNADRLIKAGSGL